MSKEKPDRKEKTPNPDGMALGDTFPDWSKECIVCGNLPVSPVTGMCSPCTFGEADTADARIF